MAIRKEKQETGFAQIPNSTLQDFSISHQARSILLYLLSLPDDWKISRDSLSKQVGIGRTTLQKYISELRQAGYMRYEQNKESDGKIKGGDYVVCFTPQKTLQASDSKGETRGRNLRRLDEPAAGDHGHIQRKSSTKKESKSVNNTRVTQKISINLESESFESKVMDELDKATNGQLANSKKHYAKLKIQEYRERFPQSESVADCWAYVVQAINHQYSLTAS